MNQNWVRSGPVHCDPQTDPVEILANLVLTTFNTRLARIYLFIFKIRAFIVIMLKILTFNTSRSEERRVGKEC